MQTLPETSRLRLVLKYLHIISSCLWLGAGFSVMVLLWLNRRADSGDELHAFNEAVEYLDNFLIIPAAAICLLSGLVICLVANLGLFSCRWVIAKWVITVAAMVFGTLCLAPWLRTLTDLSELLGFDAFTDPRYRHTYGLDLIAGSLQTAVLLYLMLISVLKPCSGSRNCVHCRERGN